MSLYTISDLHLAMGNPEKNMEVFNGWKDYQDLIYKNWQNKVLPQDIVVVGGDISWGLKLKDTVKDFQFLNSLNGTKILGKGNHDYFWTTQHKVETFFNEHGFDTLHLLFNNYYQYGEYAICGTRGWINIDGETVTNNGIVDNQKVTMREVQRLETSISLAEANGLIPIVFLHYPPIFANTYNYDILEVLYRHNVKECYYGHIHGADKHKYAINGLRDGINFHLVSGDYIQFDPVKVL